jgi:hypothetical protein
MTWPIILTSPTIENPIHIIKTVRNRIVSIHAGYAFPPALQLLISAGEFLDLRIPATVGSENSYYTYRIADIFVLGFFQLN